MRNENDVLEMDEADFSANPKKMLLDFLNFRVGKNSFPQIKYKNSLGLDYGGVTRDFVSRVFKALHQDALSLGLLMRNSEGFLIPQLKSKNTEMLNEETYLEQINCYKAIGVLFAAALKNHLSIRTGSHFHPVLFEMIHALSKEEISEIVGADMTLAHISNGSMKTYLKNHCVFLFADPNGSIEEAHFAIDQFADKDEIPQWLDKNFSWGDPNWTHAKKKEVFLADLG